MEGGFHNNGLGLVGRMIFYLVGGLFERPSQDGVSVLVVGEVHEGKPAQTRYTSCMEARMMSRMGAARPMASQE